MDSDNEKITIEYGLSTEIENRSSNIIIQNFVAPYMPKTCKVLVYNLLLFSWKMQKEFTTSKASLTFLHNQVKMVTEFAYS